MYSYINTLLVQAFIQKQYLLVDLSMVLVLSWDLLTIRSTQNISSLFLLFTFFP